MNHLNNKDKTKVMKKTSILIVTILLTVAVQAQVTASLRGGTGDKISNTFFAPAVNFKANNIAFGPEVIVQTSRDQPVNVGMRLSYQYKFIEAGAAEYFRLYSTDKYDRNKNGFASAAFVALHYQQWFAQYQYLQGNTFSIGCILKLADTQN